MSHKDLRAVLTPRPQRVQDVRCEVRGGKDPKERLHPSSSANHRSDLGNGQPSKIKINISRPKNDYSHLPKRARLDREPGELGSTSSSDSEDITLSECSSDSDTVQIITQDFEMEEVIREFKLNNLPKPVPLVPKSYSSETNSNAKSNSDTKSPEELPILASKVLATEDILLPENGSNENEPVLTETDRSQKTNFCLKCDADFDAEAFPDHVINVHLFPDDLKGPPLCPVCHELFTNKTAFLRHYKISHFDANHATQEFNTEEIMDDKTPPPLEVDSQSPAEESEEEHSSLTNGVPSNLLKSLKKDNSPSSKLKVTLTNESKEESPFPNALHKTDTSTKDAAISKIPTSNSSMYASLPPIVLPPLTLPSQQPPSVPLAPLVSPSPVGPLLLQYQKLKNAVRDPRIARRSEINSTSRKIHTSTDNRNGFPFSQLPDSMIVPIKQPPLMRTARQRVEDKWREPEIIHQQSEEIERLKALLKGKDDKLARLVREKERTIDKKDKKLKTMKNSLREKIQEVEDLGKRLQSAEMVKVDLDQSQKKLENENFGAQEQLLESVEERDALKTKITSLEKKLHESEQKYLKVVGRMKEENSDKTSKMRSLGEKVRSLTKRVQQLETYENQVTKLSEELQSTTTQLKKDEEIKKNYESEMDEKSETISDLHEELMNSQLETQAVESEKNNLSTSFKAKELEWKKYVKDLKTQIKELRNLYYEKDEAMTVLQNQARETPDQAMLIENNTLYKSIIACMEKKISSMGRKILRLQKDNAT